MTGSLQARPDLTGRFGMASSTHWTATAVAQSVLERGGNAFDAAVAGGFALHLVEPHLNGPGGDLVGLVAPAGGEIRVLMGQGPAPARASIEHFRAEGLDIVPGAGALAAAIPGAVDAWLLLLRDHGTWEVGEVLQYAIDLARDGCTLLPAAAATIAAVADLFRSDWPTSAAQWLDDGALPAPGSIIRNEAYAHTLERLAAAAAGPDRAQRIDAVRTEWAEGFVAAAIEEFVAATPHRHSTGGVHRGVLTAADLAGFRAGWEEPVRGPFRGHEVVKAGPWTQGPALLETLAILDGFTDAELDLSTAAGVHRVLEALKLGLADRDAYFGEEMDPRLLARLLSAEYAAERRALIGETASAQFRPGSVAGHAAFLPPLIEVGGRGASAGGTGEPTVAAARGTGEPTVSIAAAANGHDPDLPVTDDGVTRGDTCHIDVVDRWGNLVAVTPSGGWLQSSPFIPAVGFALGTRLQMTWLDETSPAALHPGRRPRTTLTPSLLVRDGAATAAFGSPGGDQQDQWQALLILQLLVTRLSPQRAIEAAAFHTTSFPDSFWPREWTPAGAVVEDRLGDEVIAELERRGHRVRRAGDWSLGRLAIVTRDPATGLLGAAANPRGAQGYAAGR